MIYHLSTRLCHKPIKNINKFFHCLSIMSGKQNILEIQSMINDEVKSDRLLKFIRVFLLFLDHWNLTIRRLEFSFITWKTEKSAWFPQFWIRWTFKTVRCSVLQGWERSWIFEICSNQAVIVRHLLRTSKCMESYLEYTNIVIKNKWNPDNCMHLWVIDIYNCLSFIGIWMIYLIPNLLFAELHGCQP